MKYSIINLINLKEIQFPLIQMNLNEKHKYDIAKETYSISVTINLKTSAGIFEWHLQDEIESRSCKLSYLRAY